nr:MAG TPA: hypothetical protein [Caudoviricetes sp.]
MPIVINRPQYNAPLVQQSLEKDNPLGNFGQAFGDTVETLGKIMVQSSAEATKATVSKELSQLNLETNIKLQDLQRSGATDIESQITKFQSDKIAEIESRHVNTPYFKQSWDENLWKVKDNISLKAHEAQLNSDSLIEVNNTQIALQTDLANIKLDTAQFNSNIENIFDTINNSKFMTLEQKLDAKQKYFLNGAMEAFQGDISKYGFDEAMTMLKQGKYNHEDQWGEQDDQKTYYGLYDPRNKVINPEALKAAQIAKSQDFDQLLAYGSLEDLKAIRDNWTKTYGQNNHGYNVSGVGQIWDVKTKAANYERLNKVIAKNTISTQDRFKQEKEELIQRALSGDQSAIQEMKKLDENGMGGFKDAIAHLTTYVPISCESNEESLRQIEKDIKELANIDTSEEATEEKASGMTRAMEKKTQIILRLQNLNQNRKLSEQDMKKYMTLVSAYNSADYKTINTVIDGLEDLRGFRDKTFGMLMRTSLSKTQQETNKSLANAVSKQSMNIMLSSTKPDGTPWAEGEKDKAATELLYKYKKALTLNTFPILKVDTPNGPDIVPVGSHVTKNNIDYTFHGFEPDGITPILSKKIIWGSILDAWRTSFGKWDQVDKNKWKL